MIGAGERKLIWLDGETNESTTTEFHTSFRIAPRLGTIALTAPAGGSLKVLDYLTYSDVSAGFSFGAFPEAQSVWRDRFFRGRSSDS